MRSKRRKLWMDENWRGLVWAPDRLSVFPVRRRREHGYPGIYLIWLDDALAYIGKANNVADRLCQHFQPYENHGAFSTIAAPPQMSHHDLLCMEMAYVRGLHPPNNASFHNGAWWSGPDRMAAVIQRVWRPFIHRSGAGLAQQQLHRRVQARMEDA